MSQFPDQYDPTLNDGPPEPRFATWLVAVGIALTILVFFAAILMIADDVETHPHAPDSFYSLSGSLEASTGAPVAGLERPPTLGPAWSTSRPAAARKSPVSRASSRSTPHSGAVDWDAVAKCESGGHWNHPSTAKYTGGLQMDASFWRSYHGDRFAPMPWEATKAEQIVVAERAYSVRGLTPWPYCGRFG